ncbi:MAG: VCBS repeat-containing protein [Thermodesulfobacteriota bacterium]
MRCNQARIAARFLGAVLTLSFLLSPATPVAAAGYPRRIAVAPFVSLAKEDIGSTVAVLPRLLASRLMALAGADVLLLPADGKSPAESALEAKYPLLLQGTVSKVGKGYSIDATVTDLAEGKSAGAFFASAATEDEIIAQLGAMSGEIAEKVFGVQGAVRAVSPAPVAAAPVLAAPVLAPQAIGGASGPSQSQAAAPSAAAAPAPTTLAGGWVPSSIKKVGQSDKISDELYGVVTVRRDAEGNGLVAAYGKNVIYIYQVKGEEVLPYTRIRRPLSEHILAVDAIDLDGDGEQEIVVTNLIEESIQSFILKKRGDLYEEVAGKIRYFLVVLPDWNGKPTLVGQYQGVVSPFQGKIVPLRWDGKILAAGEEFPHETKISPLSSGALGLSSGRFGNEWRLLYTDEESYLRVLDSSGKSIYKSRARYGYGMDSFEWGPYIEIEGRRMRIPLRMPARVIPGSGGDPLVLATEVKKGLLDLAGGTYDSTRLALLQWEVGEFLEKAGTQGTSLFLSGADFLNMPPFPKGGKVVASAIEQTGTVLRDKVSRLHIYRVE